MTSRQSIIASCAVLMLLYVGLIASLSALPFLDLPTHLARAYIIHDLSTDPRSFFHGYYSFTPGFDPYILGDILLASTMHWIPPLPAGSLWMIIGFVLFPASVVFYAAQSGLSRNVTPILFLLSLYLGSNWMFLSAYLNYHLALSTTFLALGFAERVLRPHRQISSMLLVIILTTATYLLHPANFLFLCLGLGVTAIFRVATVRVSIARAICLLLPGLLLSIHYLSRKSIRTDSAEPVIFRPLLEKLAAFGTMFVRYDLLTDIALFMLFIATLWLFSRQAPKESGGWLRSNNSYLYLILGTVCLVLYLILPVAALNGYDVDCRALPYGFAFLTLLVLDQVRLDFRPCVVATYASILVAAINLAYLAPYLWTDNERCERVVAALKTLPEGKKILPVVLTQPIERVNATLHTAELYAPLKKGFNPYTFGRRHGSPTEHFNMREGETFPSIFWVIRAEKAMPSLPARPDFIVLVDSGRIIREDQLRTSDLSSAVNLIQ